MRRVTILAFFVFVCILAGARTAAACSCVPPPPPERAVEQADAVFIGTVIGIEQEGGEVERGYVVRLRVDRHVKGAQRQEVTIRTAGSSAACGYYFREGKQYLVYANAVEGHLHTTLCSRTARVADAQEDLRALGIDDVDGSELVGVSGGRCGRANNVAALQAVFFVLLATAALRRRTMGGGPAQRDV